MPQSIILDTDIGTDVDDCLALALALASPELDLAAVTTVYGDVLLRSRMALKLLELAGAGHVPVAAGAAEPLPGGPPVYWAGHEGQGLLGPEDDNRMPVAEGAAGLIVDTVMRRPGEIHLVAIGPLTNVALALQREPRLAGHLAGLTIMGGVVGDANYRATPGIREPGQPSALPQVEHNFRCDPESARAVLACGAAITIVPLNVTTQLRLSAPQVARLAALDDAFHRVLVQQITAYPRYAARGWTYLHDPLAVAALIRPDLISAERLHAVVETTGEHPGRLRVSLPGADQPGTASVALGVTAEVAESYICERLLASRQKADSL